MYDQFDLQSYTTLSSLRSQPSPDIFTALSHHSSYLGKLDVFFFNFICPIILPSYNPTSYSGSYSSIIPEYILPNFPQIIVGLMTFLYLYRRIVWTEYATELDDFIPKPYQSVLVYGCNVVEASLKGFLRPFVNMSNPIQFFVDLNVFLKYYMHVTVGEGSCASITGSQAGMLKRVMSGMFETSGKGETCLDFHLFLYATVILADAVTAIWTDGFKFVRHNYVWYGIFAGFMFCNDYGMEDISVREGFSLKGSQSCVIWFVVRFLGGLEWPDVINWLCGYCVSFIVITFYR
ncbi:hypothetical protein TrVE_jg439 [Triparma verrucosa]|uniref:Uncharacterized protein n=1 Tax=Triparma verrucosa TaxID=1606542 RepID=A0A9W7BYE3_9STRA|nr:hypothetical protein TrVE_jg439 [Triparma verrucosa]